MACEEDTDYEVDEAVAEALAALHEVGLFVDLDDNRIRRLMRLGDEGELNIDPAELRSVIEAHLHREHEDLTLYAPQSVEAFTSMIDVDVSAVFFADPDPNIVHLSGKQYAIELGDEGNADDYDGTVMMEPETPHQWVACYNAALAAIGDDRHFVAYNVADFEEPIYILVTDEQDTALARADLVFYDNNEIKLPGGLWANTRATQLATGLSGKGIAARADGETVVLELDLATAATLLDRLRADLHHDERVALLVAESYTTAVRP